MSAVLGRVFETIIHTYWPYILAILLAMLVLAFVLQSFAVLILPSNPTVEIRYVAVPSPPEIQKVGIVLPCEECNRRKKYAPLFHRTMTEGPVSKPPSTESRAPYSATSVYRRGHAVNGDDG